MTTTEYRRLLREYGPFWARAVLLWRRDLERGMI
jgi:hypothetical protein